MGAGCCCGKWSGRPASEIVLDLDATDDPLYGHQLGRFFHGYYKSYCYLPLYVFCGEHLLCARLRPADIDAGAGCVQELGRIIGRIRRIIGRIRRSWPEVTITIRADSGFCREALMSWCERNAVDYVLGLAKNERLKAELAPAMPQARADFEADGPPARRFADFDDQTRDSWSRSRRVIGKAEYLPKGENPRFVVTSLLRERLEGRALYEQLSCARGDVENRIKEQQLCLFADRTSCESLRANQLRLSFSGVAYLLLVALRQRGLAGTELAQAQCDTIRLKLLKIGAQVRITVRKVWPALSESCCRRVLRISDCSPPSLW